MVVMDWLRGGPKPGRLTQLGLALGIAGVAFIVAPAAENSPGGNPLPGVLILLAATLSWAYGSVWSRDADKPSSSFLTVGMQMTVAGAVLLMLGFACGEAGRFDPGLISARSLWAWLYLFGAGSIIGFTAYIWLLQVTATARVATHAYVNPVVAVLLGVWLGKETLSNHAAAGGLLIVLAVVLILRAPKTKVPGEAIQPPALPASPRAALPTGER
jgi:drug/metabolite transporter (DMT)-like permease